jgi:RHS repeat-associated protein
VQRVDWPANVVHYYYHDHLNSTSIVTDGSGNIENESDYYPYGGEMVISSGDTNRYKFTGKERDAESGLDNFTARYYGSSLGRFMTADDGSDQDPGNPQGWNLYSYVRNNPVSNTDPTGKCTYSNGKYTPDSVSDCSEVEDKSVPPTVTVTATPGSAPAAIALNAFFALDNLANDFFAPIVGRPSYMQNTPTGTGSAAKLGAGIGFIASIATPGGEEAEVESISEKIATGHAFGKHAVELGVASKAELQSLIKRIIEGADAANDVRELSGGRVAFWDDARKAVVIYNPNAVDKGTVFVPTEGRYYFDVRLK